MGEEVVVDEEEMAEEVGEEEVGEEEKVVDEVEEKEVGKAPLTGLKQKKKD